MLSEGTLPFSAAMTKSISYPEYAVHRLGELAYTGYEIVTTDKVTNCSGLITPPPYFWICILPRTLKW
jgi:hypothetical protein